MTIGYGLWFEWLDDKLSEKRSLGWNRSDSAWCCNRFESLRMHCQVGERLCTLRWPVANVIYWKFTLRFEGENRLVVDDNDAINAALSFPFGRKLMSIYLYGDFSWDYLPKTLTCVFDLTAKEIESSRGNISAREYLTAAARFLFSVQVSAVHDMSEKPDVRSSAGKVQRVAKKMAIEECTTITNSFRSSPGSDLEVINCEESSDARLQPASLSRDDVMQPIRID